MPVNCRAHQKVYIHITDGYAISKMSYRCIQEHGQTSEVQSGRNSDLILHPQCLASSVCVVQTRSWALTVQAPLFMW